MFNFSQNEANLAQTTELVTLLNFKLMCTQETDQHEQTTFNTDSLNGVSFASRLGMQMHIVRLRLESETLLPTHQCWVSCGAAQASLVFLAVSVSWETSL